MSMTVLCEQGAFKKALSNDLLKARKIIVVTAYMSDPFIQILQRCPNLDYQRSTFIINISDGVTRKASLEYLFAAAGEAGAQGHLLVARSILVHSKLVIIYRGNRPAILYIGSSNLTAGGFENNLETNLRICAKDAGTYGEMFKEALDSVDLLKQDQRIEILSQTILDGYNERDRNDPLVASLLGPRRAAPPEPKRAPTAEPRRAAPAEKGRYRDVSTVFATDSFLSDDAATPGQFTITEKFQVDREALRKFLRRPDGRYEITFIKKDGTQQMFHGSPQGRQQNRKKISFNPIDCQISAGRPSFRTFARDYLLVKPKGRRSQKSYDAYLARVKERIGVQGLVQLVDDGTALKIKLKVTEDCSGF